MIFPDILGSSPTKYKHEVFDLFIWFKKYVENMLNTTIKSLKCDEGGEYTKQTFQKYLADHGIVQRFSCPKHPEQNGLAERKHRHLVEIGIVLLSHLYIPTSYWFDAFCHIYHKSIAYWDVV